MSKAEEVSIIETVRRDREKGQISRIAVFVLLIPQTPTIVIKDNA
jgi:hypothetical protein